MAQIDYTPPVSALNPIVPPATEPAAKTFTPSNPWNIRRLANAPQSTLLHIEFTDVNLNSYRGNTADIYIVTGTETFTTFALAEAALLQFNEITGATAVTLTDTDFFGTPRADLVGVGHNSPAIQQNIYPGFHISYELTFASL